MAKILVACEYSGAIRDQLIIRGHDVTSCDFLPGEGDYTERHVEGDVLHLINAGWDLMIAHPPCTHLAVSGARWFKDKQEEQAEALLFVRKLMEAPIPHIAIENPVSIISSRIRKPDSIVQPWMFGDEATKTTCWWLKGLLPLTPTNVVGKGERHVTKSGRSLPKWYNLPPSADRAKIRSATFPGMAKAVAEQWGGYVDRVREAGANPSG